MNFMLKLLIVFAAGLAFMDSSRVQVFAAEAGVYKLGGGDQLRIVIYGEEDLSGEFKVDGAGWVSMPLIGVVRVSGLTVRELEDAVREKLLDGYLKDPRVSAEVLKYRPFYIDGEVGEPGEYPFRQGLTIRQAASLAGGFNYWANKDVAYVRRRSNSGSIKGREEGLDEVSTDVLVRPGDYIWIK